jgi:acyl carrier protein
MTIASACPAVEDVYTVIAEWSGQKVDAFRPSVTMYELGLDSLAMASLVSHCEMQFSLDFDGASIDKLMSLQTLDEFVAQIRSHMQCGSVAASSDF